MRRLGAILRARVVVAVGLLVSSCAQPAKPVPAPTPVDGDDCDAFCVRLSVLGCPAASGSPGADEVLGNGDDVPCTTVCRDTLSSGVFEGKGRSCIEQAASCDKADACLLGD